MNKSICVWLLMMFGFSLVLGQGNDYFVSTEGNDQNSGLSISDPLQSIKQALQFSQAGSHIYLLPGKFTEKISINNKNGEPDLPITIMSYYNDWDRFAIIDREAAPSNNASFYGVDMTGSSWIVLKNLKFCNCWAYVVRIQSSHYISIIGCDIYGGKRAIYPTGTQCHHFLVENCTWEQDPKVWTLFDWTEMHHGAMEYYNGALFHPSGTGGGYVVRHNTIKNVFNAFRTKPDRYAEDGNGEFYGNTISNVADNDFEPEGWAWNIHYYHNRLHNIHKLYSIDEVRGGSIYIYGNVITQSKDKNAVDKVSGIFKFKDGPLTEPCWAFNNSYFTEAKVLKEKEATNHYLKHFNNAYYFFSGSNRFRLSGWQLGYEFDNDCINQSWPAHINNNNQEENGLENTNPLFVDAENRDFHLKAKSPCIDAGRVLMFPEFEWIQSFEGNAPDIGAFEGDALVEGPPFRDRKPPGAEFYTERPRIVSHKIKDNELVLYFSAELNQNDVSKGQFLLYQNNEQVPVQSVSFPNHGYELVLTFQQELAEDSLFFEMNPVPTGVNGKSATHWASTLPRFSASTTGIKKQGTGKSRVNLKLLIYPNPVNGIIRFDLPEEMQSIEAASILIIYDTRGRLVMQQKAEHSGHYNVDTSKLSSGIYFARVKNKNHMVRTKFTVIK